MTRTLAIGIPAYNGAEELKKTLASIETIEEFQAGELEVVIADNQSEDKTYEVAGQFAVRYPTSVKLIRNHRNLLFRKNLGVLCSNSDSKFLWFIGVGEEVKTTSLKPLLNYLQSPAGSSAKMGVLSTLNPGRDVDSSAEPWNIVHSDPYANNCFSEAISLIVVDRQMAISVLYDGEPDSRIERVFWPHLEMAVTASSHPTFQVVSPGLVSISPNGNGWWYHTKHTIPIYFRQLDILDSSPNIRLEGWWASSLLHQRRGWHFAALVFESSLNGNRVGVSGVFLARKKGVRLLPSLVSALIAISPRWVLKIAQSVKRIMVK